MNTPFVINIGRQLGSGGSQIGKLLAQRYGIAYYDKEILSQAAQESGLGPDAFRTKEERKGLLRTLIGAVQPFVGGGGDFYNGQLSDENLFVVQSRVIQRVAAERSCVFVGCVADHILRHHPRHFNVFVTADWDERVARVMAEYNVDKRTARHLIDEGDEHRSDYYNFHTMGTWGQAEGYHLCLNSSVLGIERTADYIAQMATEKLNIQPLTPPHAS